VLTSLDARLHFPRALLGEKGLACKKLVLKPLQEVDDLRTLLALPPAMQTDVVLKTAPEWLVFAVRGILMELMCFQAFHV